MDIEARPGTSSVERLEGFIQRMPQVGCPVRWYFAPGLAAREMFIPAGTVLTGAVHKTEHLNTISQGRIVVTTDEGAREIRAPFTMVSKAGTKRAGLALEDTVWTTYHATDERDPERLVELLTESKASELLGGTENLQLQNTARLKGTT
jgi:hypothetical protein